MGEPQAKKKKITRPSLEGRWVVTHHMPCSDGMFAAFVVWMFCKKVKKTDVEFVSHQTTAPLEFTFDKNDTVFFLDFCGKEGTVSRVSKEVKEVFVLDHHETSFKEMSATLPSNVHVTFDMERSGCRITLDYFLAFLRESQDSDAHMFQSDKQFKDMQQIIHYIEDRDLWRWAMADTKAFTAAFFDRDYVYLDIPKFDIFKMFLEINAEDLIKEGKEILILNQQRLEKMVKTSFEIALGGDEEKFGRGLAIKEPEFPVLSSELGNRLAIESAGRGMRAIAVVMNNPPDLDKSLYKVSFRSLVQDKATEAYAKLPEEAKWAAPAKWDKLGSFNPSNSTTEITECFGGGGHHHASGCTIARDELEKWRLKCLLN
eukprot:TRINITY_DN17509_c0_g1_i1.p1 TRINITY_DN17509_c0_g1~~TRINITY_DN17509_c0_g1_i1.p1  ORF type:complete len:372 (+),score=90.62 TRINITY_DN17509_c0_g1_i1:238-1353(+)